MAENPERAIESLLVRLAIPHTPTCYQITACAALLACPAKFQVIVEFEQAQMKVEFLAKFSHFAEHELATLRQLSVSDPLDTAQLFKRANAKLKCLKGLDTLQCLQNQIVYKVKRTDDYREIKMEQDIDELATYLKSQPSTSKANQKKKKPRYTQPRTTSDRHITLPRE